MKPRWKRVKCEFNLYPSYEDNSSRRLVYPHQLSVDTIQCFTRYVDAEQNWFLQELACNSTFARWYHLTTTTRIHFAAIFDCYVDLCHAQAILHKRKNTEYDRPYANRATAD